MTKFTTGTTLVDVINTIEDQQTRDRFFRTFAHAALVSAIRGFHSAIQFTQTLDDMAERNGIDARNAADHASDPTLMDSFLNIQTIRDRIHADAQLAAQVYGNLRIEMEPCDRMQPMSPEAMMDFLTSQPRTADDDFVALKAKLTGLDPELLKLVDRQSSLEDLRHLRESAPDILAQINTFTQLDNDLVIPPITEIRWTSKICDKVIEQVERAIMKARNIEKMMEAAKDRVLVLPEVEKLIKFIDFVAVEHSAELEEAEARGFSTPSDSVDERAVSATKRNVNILKQQVKAAEEALKVA